MWVEFEKTGGEPWDILFAAEFDSVPRVGETVSGFGTPATFKVTHVHYEIMDSKGSRAGALCTVEETA